MDPETDNDKDAAHQRPEGRWAALRSRAFVWREMMGLSIVLFFAVLGAAVVSWTLITGRGPLASVLPGFTHQPPEGQPVVTSEDGPPAFRRALDGMPLTAEETGMDYVAVLIDNFEAARPASGIAYAPLVIEAPVEAGITRLMAVFHADHGLDRIGPIRSARPYFVEWAKEYGAMLVHVGGSDAALDMLRGSGVRDLNEFSAGAYFWRDSGRDAPHNAYTSGELLTSAVAARYPDHVHEGLASWEYVDERTAEGADGPVRTKADAVDIWFGNPRYAVSWTYDAEDGTYTRVQGGKDIADEDGTPVRTRNIVVHYTEIDVIDAIGRREIRTTGEGDVLIFREGMVAQGTWRRDPGGRMRFMDGDGGPIALVAGTTWIEVVPEGTDVAF